MRVLTAGYFTSLGFTAALIISLAGCSQKSQMPEPKNSQSPASWCFSGGPIYTAIDGRPMVEALAVKDGVITYAGVDDGPWCDNHGGPDARRYDLSNAALFPGFTDAHAHFLGIGLRALTLNLEGTASITDLQNRVQAAIKGTPKGQVIFGRGWIETHWPEQRFPTRQDLDVVSPDNPVILERADGHALIVNSAALTAAHITTDTISPEGGDILKDLEGKPTGMLIDHASRLVEDLLPQPDASLKSKAYKLASEIYTSRGWTQMHTMSFDQPDLSIVERLLKSGDVKLRVYTASDISDGFEPAKFSRVKDPKALVHHRAIKLYSDGALGSRGAALLAPYSDDPDNSGLMLVTEAQIMPILELALRDGVQVCTHAIGDKANRQVLDWYETALKTVPISERRLADPRWRIEHAQIINPVDIPRFKSLGIIASMQPSHAIGDLHFAVKRLGPDRLSGGYAWRSLIDSGAIIAAGSDAPVEQGDPLIEFYAASTRKDLTGYSNQDWYPNEKVTRQEALKMFTIWPAYAAFQEEYLGTLEVGKQADLTLFDMDIMTIEAPDILNAKPIMTLVNGQTVFEAGSQKR